MFELASIFALPSVSFVSRGDLPEAGGIYFVVRLEPQELCYIGKALSLRSRWSGHHRAAQLSPDYRIHWFICLDDAQRTALEDRLIAHYTPPWNGALALETISDLTWDVWHLRMENAMLHYEIKRLNELWLRMTEEITGLRRIEDRG